MKKLLIVLCAAVFAGSAMAQWADTGFFPNEEFFGSHGTHGLAVDMDGKIWYQDYGIVPGDSVDAPDGRRGVRALHVFNPDGTHADFSPLLIVDLDGQPDTLGGFWNNGAWEAQTGRGLRMDANGNILAQFWQYIYCIDSQTGDAVFKVLTQGGSGTAPGVATETGNFFAGPVVPDNPIEEFASDGTLLGNAVDSTVGYSRTLEVSPDGNTIYWCGYTTHMVMVFERADEFSAFALTDSMALGFDTESCGWHPVTGDLWLSSGSQNDLPNRHPAAATSYQKATWYAWDLSTMTITDSLIWGLPTPETDYRPRGIGFTPDGMTAYVGVFGAYSEPSLKKFTKDDTGVWQEAGVIDGFTLAQNYPNPFNPVTQIDYTVGRDAHVKLEVYDVRGRKVATLVDGTQSIGRYSVDFNAADMPSGTYFYRLNTGSRVITNKMILSK